MPAFIVVKVDFKNISGSALYDPGANVSVISFKTLKKLENYKYFPLKTTYHTTSGTGSILVITILTIKILNISEKVLLYILDLQLPLLTTLLLL